MAPACAPVPFGICRVSAPLRLGAQRLAARQSITSMHQPCGGRWCLSASDAKGAPATHPDPGTANSSGSRWTHPSGSHLPGPGTSLRSISFSIPNNSAGTSCNCMIYVSTNEQKILYKTDAMTTPRPKSASNMHLCVYLRIGAAQGFSSAPGPNHVPRYLP